MKAKLPEREPVQLAEWEGGKLYERILEARATRPLFVMHDGPPYATGDIHLGTGLNKVLKDIVVKSRSMAGFRAPFIPGWDCHGLPIETKVEKELGARKDTVSAGEFRRKCREFAGRYVDSNRTDFKRLGIFGRWERPYLTMDYSYEAVIANTFLTFLEKGYVYRGRKPVYWCLHDETALAEAEVEYENHTSPSVWVKFPVVAEGKGSEFGDGVMALVWTTTPWTLPANRALAFDPNYEYVVAETSAGPLLVAAERLAAIASELGLEVSCVGAALRGREFEGMMFVHPFLERKVPGVLADYVTLDQGTGIVHTAPGHGADDFRTGQKYDLETYAPLDDEGRFTDGLPEYLGMTVWEANPEIIELLRTKGKLAGAGKITHSYPHCWRCHNPVIFRATEQWFVGLEQQGLRQQALGEVAKTKWTPEWGGERIGEMLDTRPDWCISRKRFWGVPIISFTCEACGKRLADVPAMRNVVSWFAREGADAWFDHEAEQLLPSGTKCGCAAARWKKENDILDVWFDSGSSHLAVLVPENMWPADVYLEGPDQYRGWFQSSLLVGVAVRGGSPYRHVVTHGWTLDDQGEPMSKSLGNFVSPREVVEKWGADLVRLWVAAQDYFTNARYSEAVMNQLSEAYRKVRNTLRFALGNLSDFGPAEDAVGASELWELDALMMERTSELVSDCRRWYEEYQFHRVYHALHDFCVSELSAFYFDVLKDRLYTFGPKSVGRRSAQTAVYRIASALVRLLAPVMVFTSEEVWKQLPHARDAAASVHLALFPSAEEFSLGFSARKKSAWERLRTLRGEVLKALEDARNAKTIGSSLEARVILDAVGEDLALLEQYSEWLPALFIVSQVAVKHKSQPGVGAHHGASEGVGIAVVRADGVKCERCWNYSVHVGESSAYPTACDRCVPTLLELERAPAVNPTLDASAAAS
jgi:isoleucyl-tRNA synthetase